jgi:plastocyanin
MTGRFTRRALVALLAAGAMAAPAAAQEASLRLTIKGNRFDPAELHAPAGKPIVIKLKNLDSTPAEFESKTLRMEKIVAAGAEVTLAIRALTPGRYRFYDDYHEDTTEGFLVVE